MVSGSPAGVCSVMAWPLGAAGSPAPSAPTSEREQEWAGTLGKDERETLIALLQKMTAGCVHFGVRHRS